MSVSMTSSIKFNHDLIDAYEKCAVLYDCDHPEYKAPAPTNDSWAFVAAQCDTTPQDCRARWKALRDRYIKERKRRMLGKCDPAKKYWPLYSRMDFLDEYVEKQRRKYPKNGLTKDNQIRLSDLPAELEALDASVASVDASSIYSMLAAAPDFLNNGLLTLDKSAGAAVAAGGETDLFNIPYEKLIKAMEESSTNGSAIFNHPLANGFNVVENNENVTVDRPPQAAENGKTNGSAVAAAISLESHFDDSPTACDFGSLSTFVEAAAAAAAAAKSAAAEYLQMYGKHTTARNPIDKSMSSHASAKTNSLSLAQHTASRKRPTAIYTGVSPRGAADTLEALRQGAESLTRCTQALLERDAEATFGDYVASVLRVMSQEKRSEMTAKIFAMLHNYQQE